MYVKSVLFAEKSFVQVSRKNAFVVIVKREFSKTTNETHVSVNRLFSISVFRFGGRSAGISKIGRKQFFFLLLVSVVFLSFFFSSQ